MAYVFPQLWDTRLYITEEAWFLSKVKCVQSVQIFGKKDGVCVCGGGGGGGVREVGGV